MVYGPRTRSYDRRSQISGYWRYRHREPDGTMTGGSPAGWTYTTQGEYGTMSDVVTERYKERSRAGEVIINPMSKQDFCVIINPLSGFTESNDYQHVWEGTWVDAVDTIPVPPDGTGAFINDATSLLTNEAYAKVTSAKASLLVTIGEFAETKDMLLKNAGRLWNLSKFVTRLADVYEHFAYQMLKVRKSVKDSTDAAYLVYKLSKKQAKTVADIWLEIRYGWQPLYFDMLAIRKALKKTEKTVKRQTFRSYRPINVSHDDVITHSWGSGVHQCGRSLRSIGHVSAGVLCDIRLLGQPDVWGLTKVPQAMWDLTRLSFVVDWFFNVADTIAAWTPDPYWRPIGNWVTVVYSKRTMTWFQSSDYSGIGYHCSLANGSKTVIESCKTRTPQVSRGIIPQFSLRMNWKRYTDALALSRGKIQSQIDKAAKRILKLK